MWLEGVAAGRALRAGRVQAVAVQSCGGVPRAT
eukprot:CAMPEP_0170296446 /NCGR_PEP_ID=MMETSP0116_2-20130129/48370_1 /TAXON_ID=400756 /ORGANISM="Durinskia baltica, Strain CSIRO CS-38" /LENGTH=32 /DNA_ID= /DNA_START= /DNA_END= /DNA_ORIENTATION=